MSSNEIDVDACRRRQQRLLARMETMELDLVVVTRTEHVQWLTGPRFGWMFSPVAAIAADGKVILVAPNCPPETAAADTVTCYEAQWHCTLRCDQRQASVQALLDALRGTTYRRIGSELASFSFYLADLGSEWVEIDPLLHQLRRYKESDELARIVKAIQATEKMYQRARAIIEPGISELEVFNQLQAAAVEELGEMLTGTGNDYQCASPGGAPRAGYVASAGDLYILDLGPAFRGYFADNCRTIAVTDPTDVQQQAWFHIMQVFEAVEESARSGTRAVDLFHQAQAILDQAPIGVFNHHLGHGVGLFPHEAPHLNPHWDETLEVGDVFTVEPGLYAPELQAGIRIENNYLVTESGLERLSQFPMEL